VYAHDRSDAFKQARAIEVLDYLHSVGSGRLSAQCLAEFFAATTRGKKPLLNSIRASRQIQNFALSWIVLDVTALIAVEAARGVRTYRLSYWDAQLWATARLNQIPVIFTEDFNTGATLEGVRFIGSLRRRFQRLGLVTEIGEALS